MTPFQWFLCRKKAAHRHTKFYDVCNGFGYPWKSDKNHEIATLLVHTVRVIVSWEAPGIPSSQRSVNPTAVKDGDEGEDRKLWDLSESAC